MEQLNRVELRGIVGSVRKTDLGDTSALHLTVATNYAYRAKDGTPTIETTWYNVKAFSPVESFEKGDKIHLVGRLHNIRYTDAEGNERSSTEIVVKTMKKITNPESLQFEGGI